MSIAICASVKVPTAKLNPPVHMHALLWMPWDSIKKEMTNRQTDRQTDRETDGQTDRHFKRVENSDSDLSTIQSQPK